MNNKKRVEVLIGKVLKSIEQASKNGNTNKILSDSDVLRKLQIALSEISKTELLVSELEDSVETQLSDEKLPHRGISFNSKPIAQNLRSGKNSKVKGKSEREKIIKEFEDRGISLIKEGRSDRVYMRGNGQTYGIAYSSEFKNSPRWWLGLPVKKYDVIILICEKSSGEIFRFIFPNDFYKQYNQYFSQSNDEYKFNIFNVKNQWEISMNEVKRIDITDYFDNYKNTKDRIVKMKQNNLIPQNRFNFEFEITKPFLDNGLITIRKKHYEYLLGTIDLHESCEIKVITPGGDVLNSSLYHGKVGWGGYFQIRIRDKVKFYDKCSWRAGDLIGIEYKNESNLPKFIITDL